MNRNRFWMVYEMQTAITRILCLLLCVHSKLVEALNCYHCNNLDNPACGMYFKPYQFTAQPCSGSGQNSKCVLQREPPRGRDHWEGIIRSCYAMGTLSTNETNGCHNTKIAGFTTTLCFCDTDYCNGSSVTWTLTTNIALTISLLFVLIWNSLTHRWCFIHFHSKLVWLALLVYWMDSLLSIVITIFLCISEESYRLFLITLQHKLILKRDLIFLGNWVLMRSLSRGREYLWFHWISCSIVFFFHYIEPFASLFINPLLVYFDCKK